MGVAEVAVVDEVFGLGGEGLEEEFELGGLDCFGGLDDVDY